MAKLLTIQDIHEDTNIPKKVIWNEIVSGRLTASKVGKCWYIPVSAWNEYFKKRTFNQINS